MSTNVDTFSNVPVIVMFWQVITVIWFAIPSLATEGANAPDNHHGQQYANHIFNAIHSSGRQFGSSLNHNGMSFFIATVPEDVQLYHGSYKTEPINGFEWLAFESEHALVFSHPPWHPPPEYGRPNTYNTRDERPHRRQQAPQIPLLSEEYHDDHAPPNESYGYLHTYRTRHSLRLLYLDGQSGAKCDKGTLDTQDIVLLHDDPPAEGMAGDVGRAASLCRLAREEWDGRVDGFVRMELGFEIILCSFEAHLDVERITAVRGRPEDTTSPDAKFRSGLAEWYRAAASTFDGIGGHHMRLDYGSFVTLMSARGAIRFDADGRPRARNDTALLAPVRRAVQEMVMQGSREDAVDWQAVADMVVARYADRIDFLSSGKVKDVDALQINADIALQPFVDLRSRDPVAEVERCSMQFLPKVYNSSSLACRAIVAVSRAICSTLMSVSGMEDVGAAVSALVKLKAWLGWTTWRRCRGCRSDEVCFVAIWPFGNAEDATNPACRSNFTRLPGGYWGLPRTPTFSGFLIDTDDSG